MYAFAVCWQLFYTKRKKVAIIIALNRLIEERKHHHTTAYYMKRVDVEVKASQSSSLVPVLTYWLDEEEVTDAILQLRLSPQLPSSYIEDYDEFQTMLFAKEQLAIQKLYEQTSLEPPLKKRYQRIIWPIFIAFIMVSPIIIIAFLYR